MEYVSCVVQSREIKFKVKFILKTIFQIIHNIYPYNKLARILVTLYV